MISRGSALSAEASVVQTRLADPETRVHLVRPVRRTFGIPETYGLCVVALMFAARFVPIARWYPYWGCRFREFTGLPCLSCGMTRSFDWFAQGRFLDALLINPLGFGLACSGALAGLYLVAFPFRPPRLSVELSPRAARCLRMAALSALGLNWAYLMVRTLLTGAPG